MGVRYGLETLIYYPAGLATISWKKHRQDEGIHIQELAGVSTRGCGIYGIISLWYVPVPTQFSDIVLPED